MFDKQQKKYNFSFESGHIRYYCYDKTVQMFYLSGKKETKEPQDVLTFLKKAYGSEYLQSDAVQKIKKIYRL